MKLQVGVKVLIQNTKGEFLFLRRSADFKPGASQNWDIPGGRIEPEEPLKDALRREVQEETGLTLASTDRLLAAQDIFVEAADLHVVRLTYLGMASGEVAISDEHDEYVWMTTREILAEPHVDSYLYEVLKNTLDL